MHRKNKDSAKDMTFIKTPPNLTPIEECLSFTKEILTSRIFLGRFSERRYVPLLDKYRDVIIVNSEETELIQDLKAVVQKWVKLSDTTKWIGITTYHKNIEGKTFSFWVKPSNLPFDTYWFQIKNIRLSENELNLNIKCIRKVSFTVQQVPQKASAENETSIVPEYSSNIDDIFHIFKNYSIIPTMKTMKNFFTTIQSKLIWKNIFSAIRAVVVILVMCIIGIVSCINSLAVYFLMLLKELTALIEAITPITIHLIDFLTKIVGGFFILLAGIFRSKSNSQLSKNREISYKALPMAPYPNENWRERNRILRQELLSSNTR